MTKTTKRNSVTHDFSFNPTCMQDCLFLCNFENACYMCYLVFFFNIII